MKQTLSRVLSKFHSSTLLLCQYIRSLYSLFISTILNILHQCCKALNFFIVNVSRIKLATVLKLWPVLQLSLHFCKEQNSNHHGSEFLNLSPLVKIMVQGFFAILISQKPTMFTFPSSQFFPPGHTVIFFAPSTNNYVLSTIDSKNCKKSLYVLATQNNTNVIFLFEVIYRAIICQISSNA